MSVSVFILYNFQWWKHSQTPSFDSPCCNGLWRNASILKSECTVTQTTDMTKPPKPFGGTNISDLIYNRHVYTVYHAVEDHFTFSVWYLLTNIVNVSFGISWLLTNYWGKLSLLSCDLSCRVNLIFKSNRMDELLQILFVKVMTCLLNKSYWSL